MTIYIFNLLAGYAISGVEYAQGFRASMLNNFSLPVRFVFTELPARLDIGRYEKIGIDVKQMISMHHYLSDHSVLEFTQKTENKLEELKESLHYTNIIYQETEIRLIKDDFTIASILLEETNKDRFYGIHYFSRGKLIRTEYYTSGIAYADYYVTAKSDEGLYAKLVRRAFYKRDGSVIYEQIWKENEERYLFPDGRLWTKSQFVAEFVKMLHLSEKDIVFLDRGAQFDFVQPLFQFGGKARFMTFFHSGHYFEKGEDPWHYLYLNWEYYYWFKYSHKIDTMIVSTQGQKEELIKKLQEYQCNVPQIAVIPASGIERLRYPEAERKKYSMISVSRFDEKKKIDWVIRSVIKAHQKNPCVFIDIYGRGEEKYFRYLQDIVSENHARSYVRFMGFMDVTEVYKNYEVYISASLGETLGLSILEAAGSGVAMIGLDVKYGNRLFIQPEKNGYLIDYDRKYIEEDDSALIDEMAEKVVEIFADGERLEAFHRASYEIARDFSNEIIAEKWRRLLT